MSHSIKVPTLGESVSEGVIVRWLKETGQAVRAGDVLCELETDKAVMEIPADVAGVMTIVAAAGSKVRVGDVVATIDPAARATSAPAAAAPAAVTVQSPVAVPAPAAKTTPATAATVALSPAVRKLVDEYRLDAAAITASGRDGRLTKADVLAFLQRQSAAPPPPAPAAAPTAAVATPVAAAAVHATGGDVERVPLTTLRKRIAERLVAAQHQAAILTTFNEIDMSAAAALRKDYRERFEQRHGVRLGYMSLFARAVVLALRDVPAVNAQIDGDDTVFHRRVHLGVAVGTERGLLVPVVRDADTLTLAELEKAIAALAQKARARKIAPDDLAGGTFTISNGGVYGSLLSTPILNPPQSGILGLHKIEDRAVVVAGQIVVRPMMYVALSYDHRLIDGEQAVTFLVRVKERIEDPARMLLDV